MQFSLFLYVCVCPDIGSWLQLFGFQLHNVVPGFPKPEVGQMEQTYELMKTQTKTQNWDSSKVSFPPHQTPVNWLFSSSNRVPVFIFCFFLYIYIYLFILFRGISRIYAEKNVSFSFLFLNNSIFDDSFWTWGRINTENVSSQKWLQLLANPTHHTEITLDRWAYESL